MKFRELFRSKSEAEPAPPLAPTPLSAEPTDWQAASVLAANALQSGALQEAIERYSALIAWRPDVAESHYKRGNAYNRIGRWQEALADYDRAVALHPDYASAYCNRGTVFERLQRWQEALASYDRALELNPRDALAHYNRAGVLRQLERLEDALVSYDRAIALHGEYLEAYVNRGHLLHTLKRNEQAAASYGRALDLSPVPARPADSDEGPILPPQLKYVLGLKRHVQMEACDWSDMDADLSRITAGLRARLPVTLPFPALAMLDDPTLQRAAAESWIREEAPPDAALGAIPARTRAERIRIGYFSADFRMHPVAHLTAGLFEQHDRTRFEVTGFAFGPRTNDAMHERLSRAFERFVDVRERSDLEVASLAREIGIDVAVNLNGITQYSRTKVFALRAAPIQISYLGYPGTMGAEYMDYLVADGTVIPRARQLDYAEKIIYLPGSFMPFDSSYAIAERSYARIELGLPEAGFVFCCFNNTFKLTPAIFDQWMSILNRCAGSVLWVPGGNAAATLNLQKEAERRGVDAQRLIFAARVDSLPEHLARLRAADLFLDTYPYNAHTTALDALWVGLPMVTREGQCFASRVAAGLLRTIGLPELIARSPAEYEELAVRLASDRDRLAAIRQALARARALTSLFDTPGYTRKLEAAYLEVYERYRSGASREHVGAHLAA